MWNFITPRNIIDFQRQAALKALDRQIEALYDEDYHVDADVLLEQRFDLMEQLRKGPVS